ncbi:MAG TPA: AAA family ATPase [Actinomycetota bacterium]|nr:AAA family ATPase [Actinomycetota bacterium]
MTSPRRKVMVVDRYGGFTADIARAAARLEPQPAVTRVTRPTRAVEVASRSGPDVVVAAPEETTPTGLRRLARIHRDDPRRVVLLAANGRPISPEQVASCGANEVVHLPAGQAKLRGALQRALEVAGELRDAPVSQTATPTRAAHVYTVASASGGCGKTFYAVNLAAYLATATRGRVLLLDLDLQFGEVSVSLRIKPRRTIAELVEGGDVTADLDEHIVSHGAGFDVLCAPTDPVSAERVGPREATEVIEAARARYDHIVVDTPPSLNEVVLAAFDRSESLHVLATMDIPSLKNLKVFLQTLDRLKLETSDVSLVLNKEQPGTGIDLEQVLRIYDFSSVLPYAPEVTRSINAGQPVLRSDPDAAISQRFVEGARRIVPPVEGVTLPWASPAPAPRRRWLGRLLRRKGARS